MPSPGVLVKQEVKEEPPDSPVDQHDDLSPQHNDEDVFLSEVNNPVFVWGSIVLYMDPLFVYHVLGRVWLAVFTSPV